LSTSRPWTVGISLEPPHWYRHGSRSDATPVLLHQGFLVESNSVWFKWGVADALGASGRQALLIRSHALHKVSRAHALGHDTALLLAEMLAIIVDQSGEQEIDVVATADGTVPALIFAMNDSRLRRLVLLDPSLENATLHSGLLHTEEPPGPTIAELDLGLPCDHVGFDPVRPAPEVLQHLDWVLAPTLVLTGVNHRHDATRLMTALPRATLDTTETSLALFDPRSAGSIAWFLAGATQRHLGGRS